MQLRILLKEIKVRNCSFVCHTIVIGSVYTTTIKLHACRTVILLLKLRTPAHTEIRPIEPHLTHLKYSICARSII